jgi:hypothetical protein
MITVVASEPQVVLVRAPTPRQGYAVIEFDFVVEKVFATMLARVVIATNDSDLGLKGYVSP